MNKSWDRVVFYLRVLLEFGQPYLLRCGFFLAVEGVPLAAEEATDPKKDLPKGIIASMIILIFFASMVLFLAPGGAGANLMKVHGAPLVGALGFIYGNDSLTAKFVNVVGLFGLIASFFSIIYAYSRQIFSLSRAGYLPRFLSISGKRKVPVWALIIPGFLGFLLSLTGEGDLMITMAVFWRDFILCHDELIAYYFTLQRA